MTEAQSKRTRLKVWQDILTAAGGTPRQGDTLYQTIRKTAVAAEAAMDCCDLPTRRLLVKVIVGSFGGATTYNQTLYQLERQLSGLLGATIPCCNLPPIQIIPTNPTPITDIYVIGAEGGGIIGGESDEMIGVE